MSSYERLTVLDELFIHLEGPTTHMHVGGIALFEGGAPDYDDVIDVLMKEGVDKFVTAWDALMETLQDNLEAARA